MMPLYEYACEEHGEFELVRSMHDSALGALCPLCQRAAPRILSAPSLRKLASNTRIALDRNEKSRHEPTVARKASLGNSEAPAKPALRAGGGRPWVLEHG